MDSQWNAALMKRVEHVLDNAQYPSSADSRPWTSLPGNLGVDGLYGCTTLVVTSREGAYMTHFWEDPSFSSFVDDDPAKDTYQQPSKKSSSRPR